MIYLAILMVLVVMPGNAPAPMEERLDLFDPVSGAHLGTEQTFFGSDGRRLRLEITGADGERSLLFLVLHDESGRESGALFFEEDSDTPSRETFAYDASGRRKTTTYYYEPDVAADRVEAGLEEQGREISKRYYRADGSQYGEEIVLWNEDGSKRGWDFRYVGREGGASFRYSYDARDEAGRWTRRTRERDGVAERVEVRTLVTASPKDSSPTALPFALDRVSTQAFETSPSFTSDGKVMVFARYGDDWAKKTAFIAYLEEDGWRTEAIPGIGDVYNLAVSPDGSSIIYASRANGPLFRVRLADGEWSEAENLTQQYGIAGAYPCLTDAGDLLFYASDLEAGDGIYLAPRVDDGFGAVVPWYTPNVGTTFDGFAGDINRLLVTRCFDDVCEPGSQNGVWEVVRSGKNGVSERKVAGLSYVWGVQPVESLGLLVFTDGEDILSVPLSSVDVR